MNSVDGAPNATISAEGATTIASNKTSTRNSLCAQITESEEITPNLIKSTIADDATDELHASDNNVQTVVNVGGQLHKQEDQQELNAASIIVTTRSLATEAKTSEWATATGTMKNTETINCETETADETAIAKTTATTETKTTLNDETITSAIIKNAETNDVQMIYLTTPVTKCKNSDEDGDPTNVDSTAADTEKSVDAASADTASPSHDSHSTVGKSTVTDKNTIEASGKSQVIFTTEGDNYSQNEMKLCRCCGKPNVTLYDLFPNGQIGDSLYEEAGKGTNGVQQDGDAEKNKSTEKQIVQIIDKEQDPHSALAVETECETTIEHKTGINAAVSPSLTSQSNDVTKTNIVSKNECKSGANTPKSCYRNIVASITAAASATTSCNKTSNSIADAVPVCLEINDPVIAAVNGGKTGDAGAQHESNSSISRVKKSATDRLANANSNSDGQGQASDNMENILQEMQIWKLWIKSNDGLPQRICPKCTAQFYIIHKFRRKCLKVQIRLRSLLNKTNSWEYEELLARATAELTEEQQQKEEQSQQHISAQSKPKSSSSKSPTKPSTGNCQRRRDQETQTTDEILATATTKTTALSVNLPPVLDIGNDLINDNYNKSAHLLMVGSELGAHNVDNLGSSNNNNNSRRSKLTAARTATFPTSPKKIAKATESTGSIVISETFPPHHPLLGDELTKSKTKVPSSSDLTAMDFEEALDDSRSERSVDQESLLATHIIFKPALTIVSPTTPTRRKYTRRKPIGGYQTNGHELSFQANFKAKDERCEDDCLTAAESAATVNDSDGVEVKNEALAWARVDQVEFEVAAMSAESAATANAASTRTFPTMYAESCERPAKRVHARGGRGGEEYEIHNDACEREKGEGDQREPEAEIASAAVFMDTRHAYFTANEKDATAAANSCDAHILIGRYGDGGGGNVVKAIADEATNAMLLTTSWHSKVADDLLRPAVVVDSASTTPMNFGCYDVRTSFGHQQEKPISGQAVAITMGWNPATTCAMAGATDLNAAGSAVTQAPTNDVQSSKQTLEVSEISNLPILAATKQTTTCYNETVKDDDAAAALKIIVSETDAAKAAAANEDNNKAVITGNTLKSSLNRCFSMRNANDDVSKDKGYFGRDEHLLPTDEEQRFAVENNVAVTDVEVDGDDVEGVETLMATVELRPQTTETTTQSQATLNNHAIKSDVATTTHTEEMMLRLKETETQTDLEISPPNSSAAFSASASSAFVTKAALKAYSTSPKARSFARRHMQNKFRRTFKGPIAQLLACSPASTSAAAAAFTALHYKKKQLRRSIGLTHLIGEPKNDATPASVAITPSTDSTTSSSSSNGTIEEANAPLPQPTFSYYATARRGRRRLKWRERSRLPHFDKHTHQHVNLAEVEGSTTINNDVQGDSTTTQTTATTQELPSCFVRLRRLENIGLSDKPAKENGEHATYDKSTKDMSMTKSASLFEGEFEAVTVIGSNVDDGSTRITLKRKVPVEEIERLSSTRSPWRTKAEMKESLQQQAALEKAKAAEEIDSRLTIYTKDGPYVETENTDMSYTETCVTDGDSAGTASGLERRSKRIKKRRKMWEEAHKQTNATPTASSDGGKVMPIILKLVQDKRPDGCVSCTPKSATTSTAAQIVHGALVSKMSAARYHVVGSTESVPQSQYNEVNTAVSQKRRRHRPKRTCCDGCMTDDTTEDDSATNVAHRYQSSRLLPPPSISQIKGGKMIIDNVNILSVKGCVESTKENCDNNKTERATASDVCTTSALVGAQAASNPKANKMSLPSQLVPLLPLLPALLPTSSSTALITEKDDATQQLSPTKTAPATTMSLKTFSSLVSTTPKPVPQTSPVQTAVAPTANKDLTQSSPAIPAVEVLSKPSLTSKVTTPLSVLLRNQLIVRVPLSALSAEFKRKFCTTTTNTQNTSIKAEPAVSTENRLVSAASPKKSTSPQATTRMQETEISQAKPMACGVENTAHVEHNNKKHYGKNNNSCSDDNKSKSVTAVSLETTAATTTASNTNATIETAQLSTEIAGDKRTQSAAGGDINTSKCNTQHAVDTKDMNTQFMRYTDYSGGIAGGGSSRYESEQSDFMGFSDGTASSPNGQRRGMAKTNSENNVYTTTTTHLHDFIIEIAPALADDESEAPQANELQATLPAGEVTAALLAEAEAEAKTHSPSHATSAHTPIHAAQTPQRSQLLSETNLSEMQDVETTLSGILNEMQDQHIYTPVSSSADDFFAQSVYSPLSEPPATPTHSMYAESPLGGIGSVGSSSMAGGGGSLSVASSPYVQHIHMEPGSVSSGQMSEPSPLPAPMSVGPSPLHHQQQQAAYGKQYANKYGECFTEDSTQSELIGFQNDIPCFENIELVATAAKTASSSPASCHNDQSVQDVEITQNVGVSAVAVAAVTAMPIEVDANCKVVDAEESPVQYIAVAQSSEPNGSIKVVCATEAQTPGLTTAEGTQGIAGKEYAVDNATLAQLLNDFEATEREALRREEEEERLRKQNEMADEQQPQLVQAHLTDQQLMEQQMVQVEVVQAQQTIQQQPLPQDESLLQSQQQHHHEDDMLTHQQILQQQKEQEHLLRRQQDQIMQQQHLLEQRHQQELLEQQRLHQIQQKQQFYERKQQQQQHAHIYNQNLVAPPKHTPPHGRSVQQQQHQKQHYIALPPSCAYEAAQMQLAQAADPIQPAHNLGMGLNLYAHNIVPGQEIQWTSSTELTSLSPTFIEASGAGGGTTYYINAADLYQPNVIAAQEQQRLPSLHHHHQQAQQQQHQIREQQLHAIELEKCSMIDANENYIEGLPDGEVAIQRQSCQQQQQQQQQQIMIVIPQDYATAGTGGAQLYTTTGAPDQAGTTYHLSPAPQTVIMQHGQPQALQMSGVNMSPQFITTQSAQRVGHHTPSPRHLQHYQIHNPVTPPIRPTNALGRPLRCASTPSASNFQQHRQQQPAQLVQHPHHLQMQQRQQQQVHQQQQSDTTKMRMVQHIRARQQALQQQQQQQQQQQLVQPHIQSQARPQLGVTAVKPVETPSQKVNLVCRFCHKRPKFTSNLDYSNHIIAMHPVETPYNCPYCPMHFTRRVKREKHIVEEHGAHRFQCAQCGQSFCTQRTLDQHLQRAHALDPTTPSSQSTQAQSAAGVQRHRQPRQIAPNVKTTQQTTSEQQQMQQRRKCFLQQRPTWLERRNRTAATIASSAATAAAATNSQTSMVRVEDVHLQVCDDAAKGKKSIDLQLDTTQLTAESTTKITNERTSSGGTPSSSGNKPQRILCCPDCDDPFNEEHSHTQPCGEQQKSHEQQQQLELQQQHMQQEKQKLMQSHEQLDQQEDDGDDDEASNEQLQQQPEQREEQLPKPLAKNAHVTLPSPEQTEPDSTSSNNNNTAILRQFRKRRASSKYAGMAALLAAGSSNGGSSSTLLAAAAAADNSNATEDELLLMERVLRNSHNCLFCDARFTNDIALRKHHQLAHSNQASMPFVCSICKRGFRMRTALQRHMETHDSEGRPYECTLCHVRFPRPSQLTLHKLTVHFLRKPHTCGVCGKQFGTESALKTHSTFHQAPSVECDVCNRKFYLKKDLRKHKRLHTGECFYKCDFCDAAFMHYSRLMGHMKTHVPLGVFLSEDDVVQLPQRQQQQQQEQQQPQLYGQQQEFEEEVEEELMTTEEQEQPSQIEIEQPQQGELHQHQDLEQLFEDEPQDMTEPQTAEPQADNNGAAHDYDANNDEDVTAIKRLRQMPDLDDEAEATNAEAEVKVHEEQRRQQDQDQAEAQQQEQQSHDEQEQEQTNDEHFAQNADKLMLSAGSCSPSTTSGISPYVDTDMMNVSSDISTTTSNASITTTSCSTSAGDNSNLVNDSESANGCSSSAK